MLFRSLTNLRFKKKKSRKKEKQKEKEKAQAGNEWSNIFSKSSQERKEPPPPPPAVRPHVAVTHRPVSGTYHYWAISVGVHIPRDQWYQVTIWRDVFATRVVRTVEMFCYRFWALVKSFVKYSSLLSFEKKLAS